MFTPQGLWSAGPLEELRGQEREISGRGVKSHWMRWTERGCDVVGDDAILEWMVYLGVVGDIVKTTGKLCNTGATIGLVYYLLLVLFLVVLLLLKVL